jgi:outer membrane receptor for ferrienterochelin and colicin
MSFLLLWVLLQASGQPPTIQDASIYGTVIDQSSGEPLRKVRVILRGSELQTVTDGSGRYRIDGIRPGAYTLYVSSIGYRLIKKDIELAAGRSQEVVFYLGQEAATIHETVRVTAPVFEEVEKTAASQLTLNNTEIRNLAGVLVDDPLRSVQTLPGVATGDDYYSYYSVRGGSFYTNGIVVDGVLTHNMAHTIQGTREPTGSVTMMNGDLVESMALFTGAFSSKYGDRTSSFLDIVTREGSRDRKHARVAMSGSNAAFVAEGPMDRARRGSWILSARKSYVDYLVRRIGPESDLNLGFGDVQGRITSDLTEHQKFGATFIWGRTKLGRNPANRGVTSLIDGQNSVGIGNLSWTYFPGPRMLWENRAYLIRETYWNRNKTKDVLGRGDYVEMNVRSDLSIQASSRHRLEIGSLLRFTESKIIDRRYDYGANQFLDYDSPHGRYPQRAVYLQDRWALRDSRIVSIFGVRVENTGLTGQTVVNPRTSLVWRLGKAGKIDAGWGIFSQFPEVLAVFGRNGDPRLRAEVARHYILGYEHELGENARFRLEAYDKEESDLQRSRDNLFRLINGKVAPPDIDFRYDNALRGHSRGFEIYLQRRSANRLAGWVSYGYEDCKRSDLVTGETYPGDFEQKHTVNIYGSYRFSESWNLSAKARFGTNFPYPGYFEARGPDFYLAAERNRERLPFYGRVDLRVNKAFYYSRSKLSLYLEILNVTNRQNIRYEQTFGVNAATRKITFAKDTLLPIIPTAGFVLEF